MNPDSLHRRSIRLSGFDYSQSNAYFVTICAIERRCLFGSIHHGEVRLSGAGQIVIEEWLKTAQIRPSVKLDEFVVMPNHFHGVIIIEMENEGTTRRAPIIQGFGRPVAKSLPAIIGAFKFAAARRINAVNGTPCAPVWQRNFYEHVIRDETSLNKIREYIINNPLSWELDRENPEKKGEAGFYKWLSSFKSRPTKG
ncbi:MAG: transposase [Deltaproteobacteria bacterium]|nr:transposase [Deltaproteobacteria bacterium]